MRREGVGEVAAAERRQPGVLDQHRVRREHRRHDHVDRDQERVVPGGDVQHDAQRLVADEPLEARLRRERLVGQRGSASRHMVSARSIMVATSLLACWRGLPIWRVMSSATWSAVARNAGTIWLTSRTRSATGVRRQSRWAARARAAVASSSDGVV